MRLILYLIIGFFVLFSIVIILPFNGSDLNDITWKTFMTASIIMAITPGANQILSLRNGFNRGVKVAIKAVSGRFSAFLLMVIAVALGLGTLLTASSVFFQFIKWIGVLYLIYLGTQMIRKRGVAKGEQKIESVKHAIKQEFIVAMSNPKAYILFAVFLPQFISVQASNIPALILITGLAYIFIEFVCAIIYALAGWLLSSIKGRFNKDKLMDQLSGFTMIGLGIWLATERPPK